MDQVTRAQNIPAPPQPQPTQHSGTKLNARIILETYSSYGGLLAISSRGVRNIRSQEDNRLLKHC